MMVRRPGSPIAGLKLLFVRPDVEGYQSQKAWKPDCGIETPRHCREGEAIHGQKAWKPDCGIETDQY